MKQVLVLGAGMVSRPLIHYLLDSNYQVTVADLFDAQEVIAGYPNGRSVILNVDNLAAMSSLIKESDLAVSLLPATRHIDVARLCLEHKKNMVTASYVSPQMRSLDVEAKSKGLIFLNEVGVDPGIDHMSAMKVIHTEEQAGGVLVGFSSWCGGLPAPEANDNPFGYKFSWSPKGVLIAARQPAKYLRGGQVVELPAEQLFAKPVMVDIPGVGQFEGYPNRDSVSYMDTYGFSDSVVDMFRGTLRNQGHCRLYSQLIQLGLFDDEKEYDFTKYSYRGLLENLFGVPLDEAIAARLKIKSVPSLIAALEYIGLFSDDRIAIERGSLVDLLANRMQNSLKYLPGQRDMLLMRHDLTFSYPDRQSKECVTAIMVDYGIPHGDTSMARTVSLPAAIGAKLILEDKLKMPGVQIPIKPVFYNPILAELEQMKIGFIETRSVI
jgi:saccharopine dehydrogenase-like NADP-dependent oxidoreductase